MVSQVLPLRKLLWRVTAFAGVALPMHLYHVLLQLRFLLEAGDISACCAIDYSGVGILCACRNMEGAHRDRVHRLFLQIVLVTQLQLVLVHANVTLVPICMSSSDVLSKLIFVRECAQADILRII